MTVLFTASLALNAFLVYLVWHRFRAEKVAIEGILNLTATEKHYVVLAMNKKTIDPSVLPSSEIELLRELSERGWLFPMGDGTYQGGPTTKADYLAHRLGINS